MNINKYDNNEYIANNNPENTKNNNPENTKIDNRENSVSHPAYCPSVEFVPSNKDKIESSIKTSNNPDETSTLNELKNDPNIHKLNTVKELNKDRISDYITAAKHADNNFLTKLLRLAQKIMTFVSKSLIPVLGWGVVFLSFLAIFTDPSQTLALLSILKGVGLGCAILYLGPILPNLLIKMLAWLETKWVQSYFKKVEKNDKEETIKQLKEWYQLIKGYPIHNYSHVVNHYWNELHKFNFNSNEKRYDGQLKWLSIQSNKIKKFLNTQAIIESPFHSERNLLLAYLKV